MASRKRLSNHCFIRPVVLSCPLHSSLSPTTGIDDTPCARIRRLRIKGPYQRATFLLSIKIVTPLVQFQCILRCVLVQVIAHFMISIQFGAVVTPIPTSATACPVFDCPPGQALESSSPNESSPVVQLSCSNILGPAASTPNRNLEYLVASSQSPKTKRLGARVLG